MRAALEQLKRQAQPYLNWAGKAERTSFAVDTVSLHVHERIDPATILAALKKRLKDGSVKEGATQGDFFRAWFEQPLPLHKAVEFYKHDRGWMNRLIAGDSLLVMNSLLQKEGMAGQVQMIYIAPPYGIKYGSNFQPFVNKRDVKDRKDEDLTQEPEMIKAFRDTWELGLHSYLTFLRDRLVLAKELLNASGSVFVQIGDENLHLVRNLMDEILGADNFVSLVAFKKTGGQSSATLPGVCDYLVWYAKSLPALKYRSLFFEKDPGEEGAKQYSWGEFNGGHRRPLSSNEMVDGHTGRTFQPYPLVSMGESPGEQSFQWRGATYLPSPGRHWSISREGLPRLALSGRLLALGRTLRFVNFLDDYPATPITNLWSDTQTSGFAGDRYYVVQTLPLVLERCVLMTTDPGDIVLDPTCGSGTTAVVAEKWGRRWITCDTSRVAITLAKQRLMTASYDYYELKYPHEGLRAGFIYQTVPHVTLKSIANNPEIDEIYERMHPAVEKALAELNKTRKLDARLRGHDDLREWEVPFDFPDDWDKKARKPFDEFHAARQSMQKAIP